MPKLVVDLPLDSKCR